MPLPIDLRFRNVLNPRQTLRDIRAQSKTLEKVWSRCADDEERTCVSFTEVHSKAATLSLVREELRTSLTATETSH